MKLLLMKAIRFSSIQKLLEKMSPSMGVSCLVACAPIIDRFRHAPRTGIWVP